MTANGHSESYCIVDVDVTQPLPTISLRPSQIGAALIIRRHGRPIGFVMRPLPQTERTRPDDVARLVAGRSGMELLSDLIAEELLASSGGKPVEEGDMPSLTVAICTKDHPE